MLHEVTTDPALVMSTIDTQPAISTVGWTIYVDLGDGPVLATYLASSLDNQAVSEIPLEAAGVAAVQAARGALLAVGLRVDSLDRVEGVFEIFPAAAPVESSVFEIELELAALCDDGIDNDGDGRIDFPHDPERSSATDRSERPPRRCGLGLELAAPLLLARAVRRRFATARG